MKLHSIRTKVTAIAIAAVLVTILSVFVGSYSSVVRESDRRSVETMNLIGDSAERDLERYLQSIEQSVEMAANLASDTLDSVVLFECGTAEDRTPEQQARLDAYLADYCTAIEEPFGSLARHSFGVITYYYCLNPALSENEHGFFYSRVGKTGFYEQPPLDARELDPADVEHTLWYYQPIERGRPSWVGPYRAYFLDEMWTCSYLVPIYKGGALIGVLGMDIPVSTLAEQVNTIRVYSTGFVSLLDEQERIVYHPQLEIGSLPKALGINLPDELFAQRESGSELIRYVTGTPHEERQLVFQTLTNGMKLVVSAPTREINASWVQLVRVVVMITVLALIIFALILLYAMGLITRPLRLLTAASSRLADGDYDVQLPYAGHDEVGELTHAFTRMRDQIKAYIEDLSRRIYTDSLTGLANMRGFFRLAPVERDRLTQEGQSAVMLYFDMVGMKHFNRQYGFEAGDRLLLEVAAILRAHYGEEAMCRFGQDHFAAVTAEANVEAELKQVFAEIQNVNQGNSLPVRVGIYREGMEDVSVSVACDRAKYACDRYRGSYISSYYWFNTAMLRQIEASRYIIRHLDQAIAENWIQVYYQPIVRAVNGRVCDEEALARWVDPKRGTLSPAVFIPVLEDARLIYKLDLYVLDQILAKMQTQAESGLRIVPHSLNLSRADFDSCDIVEEIRSRVDASGIGRDKLTIEITESMVGSDFEFMKNQVERFQSLGFRVWMDDFGSGYSALDVLQDIHFDLIKFDLRFMHRFGESDENKIILTELIRMANGLGVDTVCEGVESSEQVDFLREAGCTKLQGFYYCRPISFAQVQERYRNGTAIGFENPEETEYYSEIGRVKLDDLAVMAGEGSDGFKSFFNTMPMGILEVCGSKARFVRTNESYRAFMKHYFDFDVSDTAGEFPASTFGDGFGFLQTVRQCCDNGGRALFNEQMSDGSTVHSFARRVGVNPVTGATALAVVVLSVMDSAEGATYADIARALAADYYNIYYIDLDTDHFIEYSSPVGGEEMSLERHGEDFFNSARRDTLTRIYGEDREAFLAVFTRENVLRELNTQGVFTVTYRLIDTGEPIYVNMKITRTAPNSHKLVLGVSIIDNQMRQKEQLESMQRDRDALARIMALSEDYLTLFTIDPDTGRYLESSATSEYEKLGFAKDGADFFTQCLVDAETCVAAEDLPAFRAEFTRANILGEIREHGSFTLNYRLLIDGVPRPVSMRIAAVRESDGEKLVAGVRLWKERRK